MWLWLLLCVITRPYMTHYYIITGFVKITQGLVGMLHHYWDHFGVWFLWLVRCAWVLESWALVELERARSSYQGGVLMGPPSFWFGVLCVASGGVGCLKHVACLAGSFMFPALF